MIGIHQQTVGETLGEEDGVALIDESSAVKQGDNSVGVASQYCGSVGKVANGQVKEIGVSVMNVIGNRFGCVMVCEIAMSICDKYPIEHSIDTFHPL